AAPGATSQNLRLAPSLRPVPANPDYADQRPAVGAEGVGDAFQERAGIGQHSPAGVERAGLALPQCIGDGTRCADGNESAALLCDHRTDAALSDAAADRLKSSQRLWPTMAGQRRNRPIYPQA